MFSNINKIFYNLFMSADRNYTTPLHNQIWTPTGFSYEKLVSVINNLQPLFYQIHVQYNSMPSTSHISTTP